MKPKEEKDDAISTLTDSTKIKTEVLEEGQLKHTEDSTALKNAILGPQPSEPEGPPETPSHPPKTENISNGEYFYYL